MEWFRFWVAALFIIAGIITMIFSVTGVYKFHYALNRMHAAALGDTMGIFLIILGLATISGITFVTLKLFFVLVFFWLASPVAGHLISRMEVTINERLKEECEVEQDGDI